MIKPEPHAQENERLKALQSYSIMDTLPEIDYDNITTIAAEICNTPIALITLIDNKRQWFKSHHGVEVSETPKDYAFCAHAINDPNNLFIVHDARIDERFCDNPLVTGDTKVIFYAGVPLIGPDHLPLGTLCVIDNKPKTLSPSQVQSLKALSNQVMNLLELRKAKANLELTLENLEQVNKQMESFAYIAAHDLKSPLHNISSLAALFLKKYHSKIDKEGSQYIGMISSSADKLKKLIDGLLEYSKSNKILKENKSEVNLQALKYDIESLFNFKNNCSITLQTSLHSIFTNKTAIEQILMNLVSNSIKYNNKSKTKIVINIAEVEEKYIISFIDNGPGIPKEYQHKVFEIFEVLTSEDRFGQRGNGIGLALVKKIVEASGGSITIESETGAGAKFIFTLEK